MQASDELYHAQRSPCPVCGVGIEKQRADMAGCGVDIRRTDVHRDAVEIGALGYEIEAVRERLHVLEDRGTSSSTRSKAMTPIFVLLSLQGLLGALDNLWHDELKVRLPSRSCAQRELALHALRGALYAPVFLSMGWLRWEGWMVLVFGALLAAEIGVTLLDFVQEDRSRVLPATERVLHTILAHPGGAARRALGWGGKYRCTRVCSQSRLLRGAGAGRGPTAAVRGSGTSAMFRCPAGCGRACGRRSVRSAAASASTSTSVCPPAGA